MPDLLTALRDAGLVSAEQVSQEKNRRRKSAEKAQAAAIKKLEQPERVLKHLYDTSGAPAFRTEAFRVLVVRPDLIGKVIEIAHKNGLKTRNNGGTRLIVDLLQLRDELAFPNSIENKRGIVRTTFPKS